MTKQDLQKELKEKVREGVKPSDLKKLKRSKSADDISLTSPLPSSVPLSKSQSQQTFSDPKYPYTTLISQQQELENLRKETETKSTTISLLRKKISELEKEIKERGVQNDALLVQLAETMKELNSLKEKEVSAQNSDLDQALFARHKNLKDWFTQFQKTKQLDKELADNVNEASNELLTQDETISNLRTELRKLKQTNQSLEKDLSLAQRLAESRKIPFLPTSGADAYPFLKYALYSFAVALFTWWLMKSFK